jgi:hypothetical protein
MHMTFKFDREPTLQCINRYFAIGLTSPVCAYPIKASPTRAVIAQVSGATSTCKLQITYHRSLRKEVKMSGKLQSSFPQHSKGELCGWSSLISILSPKVDRRQLVDRRMLPLLGFLYAVALIDRTNLGIARVAGMAQDLVRTSFSLLISEII